MMTEQQTPMTSNAPVMGETQDGKQFEVNAYEKDESPVMKTIIEQLQTVYDPEFPLIDIYTLGLIYAIDIFPDDEYVAIIMTYTTPACPAGELIQQMIQNAITAVFPTFMVTIQVTFEPYRDLDKIKDQDLRRMFE